MGVPAAEGVFPLLPEFVSAEVTDWRKMTIVE